MSTLIARFIDLGITAIPSSTRGKELCFSKMDNPRLCAALKIGERYQVTIGGKLRVIHYQRSPLTHMFLFSD